MDDLTKELWQGVTERVAYQPEPADLPAMLVTEAPRPVADETSWREFLVSPTLGATLALACVLGLLAIFSAHPLRPGIRSRPGSVTLPRWPLA
jgi:hypothetical protein